jgi:putative membrane protein
VGWLVVGFLLLYALQKIDEGLHRARDWAGHKYYWRYVIGVSLYAGVILFNLSVTFYIRAYNLGWAGIFIILLPSLLLFLMLKLKLSCRNLEEMVKAHLMDFPQAVIPD